MCSFNKTLVLSISCNKCESNNDAIFEKEESIVTLKILGLIDNVNKNNLLCQMWKFYLLLTNMYK